MAPQVEYVDFSQNDFKKEIFNSMDQLEGWCSKEKASVLVDIVRAVMPKTIVEVGVFGGKSLIPMAFALKKNGFGNIYGIDPWLNAASIAGMEKENLEYWGRLDHEKILLGLVTKIHEFGLQD